MDIKDYIASGILEAYALDDLPQEERAAVEAMLAKHPELREELNSIEEGLETLAMETAIAPPADLKDSLMATLDDQGVSTEKSQPETKVVPIAPKKSTFWNYVAAASISIALVSSLMAYDFYSRWKQTEAAYADLADSNEILANQINKVGNELRDALHDYNVVANPDFNRTDMTSVIKGKSFAASVHWNKKTEEAYLSITDLAELTREQQYQLWAIVDGKPVSMGVFDLNKDGLMQMTAVANASTFAVTIEPRGGSENPTLDAMQVAGEVG